MTFEIVRWTKTNKTARSIMNDWLVNLVIQLQKQKAIRCRKNNATEDNDLISDVAEDRNCHDPQ